MTVRSIMRTFVSAGLMVAAGLLSACAILEELGAGCETEGTVGAEGKVVFSFMQSDEDLSASSGKAFAAGTSASLAVEPASGSGSLPSFRVQSGDEEILAVEEADDDGEDEDYPVTLSMKKEGKARVEVVGRQDGATIDYVDLKVLDPDGLEAHVSHPVLGRKTAGETVAFAAGGAGCLLDFLLYVKEGTSRTSLFGEFELTCDDEESALSLDHDPIAEDHPYYAVTVAATGPGSYDLAFVGPGELEADLTVSAVSPAQVDAIDLVFTPMCGDGRHAGDRGFLTGVQYASSVPLCSGHPVVFRTSDPSIASLDGSGIPEGIEDTVGFVLNVAGVVRLTATLLGNPAMESAVDLVVQPAVTN
jgi:hypothetical protein